MTRLSPRNAEVKEAIVSIVVNLILWILRLIGGMLLNSVALISDAWHGLSDSFSSLIILLSSRIAARPADKEHPYGHGKAADLGTLILGITIVGVGSYFIYESIFRIMSGFQLNPEFSLAALAIALGSAGIKEVLARWAIALGIRSGSNLCRADAWHHRVDALLTFGVAVSIGIYAITGFNYIDPLITFIISAFIIKEGGKIARDSLANLMDQNVENIASKVANISITVPGVKEVHDVRVRGYGGYYAIELNIHVDRELSIEEAHKLAHSVEEQIKMNIPRVIHVHVHIEPDIIHK